MRVADQMRTNLAEALKPVRLEVIDESDRHVGHAGHRPGGQTHFRIEVVSAAFAGKSRVDRHRMINDLVAEQLAGGVHALSLSTLTPEEADALGA
ncbi:MAG: BolA family protein [Actinomycetota bacterium]